MRWVMKVSKYGNQTRITLPGSFCKTHGIDDSDYMIIDDREPNNITIRRLEYGEKDPSESKRRIAQAHR